MFLSERTLDRIVEQLDYNLDLKEVITDNEYQVLERDSLVEETRDQLFVPNGLVSRPCFYKITKVIGPNFNIMSFLNHIMETIPLPFEISVDVGFFIREMGQEGELLYVKPSTTQSLVTANITNLEHYWRFRKDLRKLSTNICQSAFDNAQERRQIKQNTVPISANIICVYLSKIN